jgi:hypothetical protein
LPARRGFTLPATRRAKPRFIAASLALHGLFVVALVKVYSGFVNPAEPSAVVAIALAPMAPGHPAPGPGPAARGRPLVVPTTSTPILAAAAPAAPPAPIGSDSTGVAGGHPGGWGLALGPGRGDSRIWVAPLYIPDGGGRPIDMDSMVRHRLLSMADLMDSISRNGGDSLAPNRPFTPPRWTFERNGRTYGIDQTWIHFGAFKLPTALLALLPIPQGNYGQAQAYNRQMDMRADILRAAARSEAEDDFRRAVVKIRERRDRERAEQRAREESDRQRSRDNDRPIP